MVDSGTAAGGLDLDAVREEAAAAIAAELGGEEKESADVDIQAADVDHARDLVLEKGLETTDFVRFRSFMLQDDYEPDEIEQLWAILRDEDAIPKGSRETFETSDSADEDDGDTPEHDHGEGRIEETPGLEAAAEGAEAVYLLKTANCPTCIQAQRALEGWIDDGLVTPLDFPDEPLAEAIVDELGIREVPTLVAEVDGGQYRAL